jgi:N12 class adenine-specific DNA methylase
MQGQVVAAGGTASLRLTPETSASAGSLQRTTGPERSLTVRWKYQETLWRAIWPTLVTLCQEDVHTLAIYGASSVAALSVIPDGMRAQLRIEPLCDPPMLQAASTAYPGFSWSPAGAANLPPGYADLVVAEVEADASMSTRTASFVCRLRQDEEQLIDLVTGLRGGGLFVGLVHGGMFERSASAARERIHELADVVAMAKIPLTWVRERSPLGPLDLVVLRKRLPRERTPPHARYLSLTNIDIRGTHGARLRTRINAWYQESPAAPPKGTFGQLYPVPVATGHSLAVHGSELPGILQTYLAQCVTDYLSRRQVRSPVEPRPAVRLSEVPVNPPHGMADFFAATETVELPCDLDGQPIALLPGRLLAHAGLIYEVVSASAESVQLEAYQRLSAKSGDALYRIIQLRDAMYETLRSQNVLPADPIQQEQARRKLNTLYDEFVRRHGPLNAEPNRRLYINEPDSGRIASLEVYTDESAAAEKSEIFFGNVLDPCERPTHVATLADALAISLDKHARLDPADIAVHLAQETGDIERQLVQHGLGYFDPATREWQTAAQYLSGDVVSKLAVGRSWAQRDTAFEANVEALTAVQAEAIPAEEINVRMGAPWVPEDVVEAFLDHLYGIPQVATVSYTALSGTWSVQFSGAVSADPRNTNEFGTRRRPFPKLFEAGLNQRSVDVYDKAGESAKLNVDETLLAHERLAQLEHAFTEFLWMDPERRERLARIYNEGYNRFRSPRYDGSHLTFPGMSRQIQMLPHQRNDVWRFLMEGNLLLARAVGRGKTFTQVACAMEAKRLGRARKPAWAVPDELLGQSERQARRLYPGARIFAVSYHQISESNRERTLETISGQEWDLVIYSHSAFTDLRLSEQYTELAELYQEGRALQEGERVSRGRLKGTFKRRLSEVNKRIQELRAQIAPDTDEWRRLGHDTVCVDEAHRFKNLGTAPGSLQAGATASQRASDLLDKVLSHYEATGEERGVVLSTATPLSNSLLELFTLQRYLVPSRLTSMGMHSFRLWSNLFLKPIVRYEPELTGEGFRTRTRYVLQNAPEALGLLRNVLAVNDGDEQAVTIPEMETINIAVEMSPAQKAALEKLQGRLKAIRAGTVSPRDDHLLRIVTDSRKLGLDVRLLDSTAQDWHGTKVHRLVGKLVEIYHEWNADRGVQLVFCDLGVPNGRLFDLYAAIRQQLVEKGIPAAEVAFVHDYAGADKAKFFNAVRARLFRIGIGSTEQMGEGGDMQTATVAVHHLDGPWRASDIEQRDGRARRPGNLLLLRSGRPLMRLIYTTKDSFDRFIWDVMRLKNETFSRLLRGDPSIRSFDTELDPSYAQTVAITSGNPILKAQVELQDRLARLRHLSRAHAHQLASTQTQIEILEERILRTQREIEQANSLPSGDGSGRWRYKAHVDGLPPAADFEGGSHEVFQRSARHVRENKLTDLRGLTCSGLAVRVSVGWDAVAACSRLEWFLCFSGRELRYWGPSAIADAISDKETVLQDLRRTLGERQRELTIWNGQAHRKFPHERDLQLCARALKVVEEMIQVDSKAVPTDIDIDVRRELLRCMLGTDGDTLEQAQTKEIQDEQPQEHRRVQAPRRRQSL